jgi:hypothetical protein
VSCMLLELNNAFTHLAVHINTACVCLHECALRDDLVLVAAEHLGLRPGYDPMLHWLQEK